MHCRLCNDSVAGSQESVWVCLLPVCACVWLCLAVCVCVCVCVCVRCEQWVGISSAGFVASYSVDDYKIYVHTYVIARRNDAFAPCRSRMCTHALHVVTCRSNGTLVAAKSVDHQRLYSLRWSEDGLALIVGGASRFVIVVDAMTLTELVRIGSNSASLKRYDRNRFRAMGVPPPASVLPHHTDRPQQAKSRPMPKGTSHQPRVGGGGGGGGRSTKAADSPGSGHRKPRGVSADSTIQPFGAAITSILLTRHERELLVGLADGSVAVFAPEALYFLSLVAAKLVEIGF